jgi:putative transposase
LYVWADGVYLQARMEKAAECMLVLIGATPEGRRNSLASRPGCARVRRAGVCLLVDIKQRGLEITLDLAVGDGALGFWKATQ